MCVSGQVLCECNWPRDTVRHCTKYVQTGELCPGLSKFLLADTERRKTDGGVYKCSNPTCEIWDLEMCRGIRERGKYMDRQLSLVLGQWSKEEDDAEKATVVLANKANPVESGGEDHASIVAISDDSGSESNNDEGLEMPQHFEPVATGELELQPAPTFPEEAQHVEERISASIPKPEVDVEVDEATDNDLDSLFGGASCPPTPDMRLIRNHHSICLPTGVHLPSPPLSQPTPENPVKEGNSHTPPADTKSEQASFLILPTQAPPQQQQQQREQVQLEPTPQPSHKLGPTYPAQNTMAMGNKTPASYPAVPQHMRPTLSGPNQATLRALRAQTLRCGATPTASPTPVHAASVRAASQCPRPSMNTSRFEGYRRPNIQQRRPMMPAGGMPIQNGYTASPQVSQRPVPTNVGQNTMAMGMGNNMPNGGGQGMSLAMSAQATGSQGMPSQYVAYQNMPPQIARLQGLASQGMASQSMASQGMATPNMLPQNMSSSPGTWTMSSLGTPYQNTSPQFCATVSPQAPQQASGSFTNFVQSPQTPYRGIPTQGMLPQGMPPQNGYVPSPVMPQIRTPRTFRRASNGMLSQQGYMNPVYMANAAAPSQHTGLNSPMAGPTSPWPSTGNTFLQPQLQPQPQIQPQPFFNSKIWEQSQAQMASRPQMASGMPGMPPTQTRMAGLGPASGQRDRTPQSPTSTILA
ncbi:hypothetical protein CaCOL14_006906 [Colletotrichum acutatum]